MTNITFNAVDHFGQVGVLLESSVFLTLGGKFPIYYVYTGIK